MKGSYCILLKSLVVVLTVCGMLLSNGCQKEVSFDESFDPVFFPPPPNQPRLQFLKSYADGSEFDVEEASFLESFVLGDPEVKVGIIGMPYGVAIHDGKIYVCDVGQSNVKVLDLVNNTFSIFPSGRSLKKGSNIFIEPDGTKYITDPKNGVVSVWNAKDKIVAFLGKDLGMKPLDVSVSGDKVFVTDGSSNQVLVLDKHNGELLDRIGKQVVDRTKWGVEEFSMITDLCLDKHGNIYVGDKLKGKLTVFKPSGVHLRSYGKPGSLPNSLIRVKGSAVDREDRVWVIDAGPATAVKVFRKDGRLLMMAGFLGQEPGQMYAPVDVVIDYDNVKLFEKYAVKGAKIEFLVLVTNQFGPHKVSVYGFGTFPKKYSQAVSDDLESSGGVEVK